jgi:tRNA-modifying protein YgfZ
MTHRSPLLSLHQHAGAPLRTYGPEGSDILVPEVFAASGEGQVGGVEVEYAAIRKHAGILDQPQRATIEVSGSRTDRHEFLNRMVTQELKGLDAFHTRRSLWLNRKGRIDADLRLIELGSRMLLDCDAFAASRVVETLGAFVFAEDVRLVDRTSDLHRLALHGPSAREVIGLVSSPAVSASGADVPPSVLSLEPGRATVVRIADADVIVDRWDSTGDIGLELTVDASHVERVYLSLAAGVGELVGAHPSAAHPRSPLARRIGWHAYNIARIEAGTPLYYLDFGPDSLPHEVGEQTLHDRVSFKKGCYLGQEVVARMQSLGHPKQRLVAVRFESTGPQTHQPETGAPLHAGDATDAPVIGAVTSSTLSPMLSQTPCAFAMVKWANSDAGKDVFVRTGGGSVRGVIQPSLTFWSRAGT